MNGGITICRVGTAIQWQWQPVMTELAGKRPCFSSFLKDPG
jgi:hypothetical protein